MEIPRAGSSLTDALAERYTLERELGRGGMATVFLAEDLKHGRKVAIKVLSPVFAASLGAERFLREIGIAARLAHPHILPLIDSGSAAGSLYYVAPYVDGGSLRDRLSGAGQLPVQEALRIATEVGAGLDYVHRGGFVHRDVKPENILFADGHALLADFGIAMACCDEPEREPLTDPGLTVGTPEYMSPEQASGERSLDSTSDIYSFACVVYEMLAGEPPFSGGSTRAIISRQVTETPRPLRALRPDASPALDDALARALAKNPAHRFATIPQFLEALDESSAGGAPRHSPTRNRSIAVLPFVNTSADAENEYFSDGVTDELIGALARIEGFRVASRTSVFALKGKPLDVRAIGALLGVSTVLEGTVRRAGDQLRITAQLSSTSDGRLLWSQRFDRRLEDVFAVQDELAHTIVGTLRDNGFADLWEPRPRKHEENLKAYGLYLKGRYEWNQRTRESVQAGIGYFEQAIAEEPGYARAYAGLADSYSMLLDYRSVPVADGFERAKLYARKAIELDDTVAEAHTSLGWSLFIYDWDWDAASREMRRAIELDPRYATAHQWHSFLLASLGRMDDAIVEGHTALELDPASVSIRRSMGWTYYYARRYEQAQYHLRRAIEMNPAAAETYRVLGLVLASQGKMDEAEQVMRDGQALPASGAYGAAALGYVLGRVGRRQEAADVLRKLESRARDDYVSPVAFATIHLGLEDWDRAFAWMERAFDERRGWLPYLNVNPIFDPVRADPRFVDLVHRVGLAGAAHGAAPV